MADIIEYIPEKELEAQLGIPHKKLRGLRPAGFMVDEHGVGQWPAEAATALCLSMGAPVEKTAPEPDVETLTVISIPRINGHHYPNKTIIMAARANGEAVTVKVADSSKYQPRLRLQDAPMTFQAKKSAAGNWWQLIGREPRYRGQW